MRLQHILPALVTHVQTGGETQVIMGIRVNKHKDRYFGHGSGSNNKLHYPEGFKKNLAPKNGHTWRNFHVDSFS